MKEEWLISHNHSVSRITSSLNESYYDQNTINLFMALE